MGIAIRMNNIYNYKLDNGKKVEIKLSDNVFHPTGTSEELIKSVSERIEKPGSLLDLGCGSGLVGLVLYVQGQISGTLYASDISSDAITLLNCNARKLHVPVKAIVSDIFESINRRRFDYIVNDISGISQKIAALSPWFKNTLCSSGNDGTDLVVRVINEAAKYLLPEGKLFFPVLSLSNTKKILDHARKMFRNVEMLSHKDWVLPEDLMKNIHKLKEYQEEGFLEYVERFGLILWYTEIYMASSPHN